MGMATQRRLLQGDADEITGVGFGIPFALAGKSNSSLDLRLVSLTLLAVWQTYKN